MDKEKIRKKCEEVWNSANRTISGNENVLDTQSLGAVIGVSIIIAKISEFQHIPNTLKILTLVVFAFSVVLCLLTPIWFIRCRRIIQEKIRNIIHNHYKKNDGTMYNETDIDEIHKKYAGHILPLFKIHILELLRFLCVVICVICVALSLVYMYTENHSMKKEENAVVKINPIKTEERLEKGRGDDPLPSEPERSNRTGGREGDSSVVYPTEPSPNKLPGRVNDE